MKARRFNDRNVLHGHGRRKKTRKYLREGWHHHIKCTTTTLLATFMWGRRLNNTTLATATHRKLGKVADGTSTQVKVQMINKWRVKMIQKRLYKVEGSSWKEDRIRRGKKKQYSNLNHSDIWEKSSYTYLTSSDWKFIEISNLALCLIATRFNTSRCPTH